MGLAVLALLAISGVARAQIAPNAPGVLPLTVHADAATTVTGLLDRYGAPWPAAPEHPLHFSRTPPLYYGDPLDDDARPTATLRLVRIATGDLVLRIRWADPTRDELGAGRAYPDTGAPHIYKTPTESTNAFADAFCAMVPVQRGPMARYPTLMMGDATTPVQLFYWRAGLGFQLLAGHGRASTATTNTPEMGRAVHEEGGWTVTLAIPDMKPRTPISFAIWQGSKEQRDGIKYFTVWYEVQ